MSFIFDTINNALGIFGPTIKKPQPLSGFSIDEFKATALHNGLLKKNLYLVNFNQHRSGYPLQLMFLTDAVTLPAVDMYSYTIRRYGYGPIENVPFRPVFEPLRMTFMVESSQENVLTTVLSAMNGISNFMGYNDINSSPSNSTQVSYPYEVAYKKDYEFDLEVYVYNEQQDNILTYTFRDCYAKEVSGISLGWGDKDTLMKADITFMYTDYSIYTQDSGSLKTSSIFNIQSLLGLSSLSSTFNAVQYPQAVSDALSISNNRALNLSAQGSSAPYNTQATIGNDAQPWINPDFKTTKNK